MAAAVVVHARALECGFVFDDHLAVEGNPDTLIGSSWRDVFVHDFWGKPLRATDSHKSYRPLVTLSYRADNYVQSVLQLEPLATAASPLTSSVNTLAWSQQMHPMVFHATNLLIHALVCALVTLLTYQLLQLRQRGRRLVAGHVNPAWRMQQLLHNKRQHQQHRQQAQPQPQPQSRHQSLWWESAPLIIHAPALAAGLLFAVHPAHTEAVIGIVGRAELMCAAFSILFFMQYVLVPPTHL